MVKTCLFVPLAGQTIKVINNVVKGGNKITIKNVTKNIIEIPKPPSEPEE